ncbi:MAG: hypothetical protein ACFCU1_07735 [Sumerlaeia bacterium]
MKNIVRNLIAIVCLSIPLLSHSFTPDPAIGISPTNASYRSPSVAYDSSTGTHYILYNRTTATDPKLYNLITDETKSIPLPTGFTFFGFNDVAAINGKIAVVFNSEFVSGNTSTSGLW